MLLNATDAVQLGLKDSDRVILKNDLGELCCQVYIAPIQSGNLQVHWPEGNVLLDKSKRSLEGVPDYNAIVRLEKSESSLMFPVLTKLTFIKSIKTTAKMSISAVVLS